MEYRETRPATDEEKEHVRVLAHAVERRVARLRAWLYAAGAVFIIGLGLIFSIGMLIVMVDLFVIGRLALAYRDAKKPLALVRASANLTQLAIYGNPSEGRWSGVHPETGLLVWNGEVFVSQAIRVEGVHYDEPNTHQEAGWYPLHREHDRGLDRRPLSTAELTELNRRIGFPRIRINRWILLATWIFLSGTISTLDAKDALRPMVIFLSWCGLLGVLTLLVKMNVVIFRLWRDRGAKEVARAEDDGVRIEFLPHSRVVWTIDGEPSEWRRGGVFRVY